MEAVEPAEGLSSLLDQVYDLTAQCKESVEPQIAEQLRAACSALSNAARSHPLTSTQHQELWQAACMLWNNGIDLSCSVNKELLATLKQCTCDLADALPSSLLEADIIILAEFHRSAGRSWAGLDRHEAADAVLAKGLEHKQFLQDFCLQGRAWGQRQAECAEVLFGLLADRLHSAHALKQHMLTASLVSQAKAFVSDGRLPTQQANAFRLLLVGILKTQGQQLLVQAGQAAEAEAVLNEAYAVLGDTDAEALPSGEAELRDTVCAVLTLLASAHIHSGSPEKALGCVHALQGTDDKHAMQATVAFLSLQALLGLGRLQEAETELLDVVSHEQAGPELCAAAVMAALKVPGGHTITLGSLAMALERFPEEPGMVVSIIGDVLTAGADTSPELEGLVLELAGEDRVQEALTEEPELRQRLHALLWNHAVMRQAAESSAAALAFFSAALPLAPSDEQRLACLRSKALCCLGTGQHEEALQSLAEAEQLQPGSTVTVLLRLKVCLAAGQEEASSQAVQALMACSDATPDILRVACCEAVAAKMPGAGKQALLALLDSLATNAEAAAAYPQGYEGTIFQNLIQLVQQAAPAVLQAAAASATAASQAEAGNEIQQQQQQQEQQAAEEEAEAGHSAQATAMFASCGDLLAALPEPDLPALHRCRTAYLLAAAALAEVMGKQPGTKAAYMPLAGQHLQAGRAASAAWHGRQALGAVQGADAKPDIYILLLQFELASLAEDAEEQQAAIQQAQANPAFTAEHFLRMAGMSKRQEQGPAATGGLASEQAAYLAAYQRFVATAPINYDNLALTLRALINLAGTEADKLAHLRDASSLLESAPAEAYPAGELRWLITYAWNRGASHARFARHSEAVQYQRWACGALQHAPAAFREQHEESMRGELERSLAAQQQAAGEQAGGAADAMVS